MNRSEYNTCVADGMRGRQLTKEERKLEFCITAKTCSGKASTREDAEKLCIAAREENVNNSGGTSIKSTKRRKKIDPVDVAQCLIPKINKTETLTTENLAVMVGECTGSRVKKPLTYRKFMNGCKKDLPEPKNLAEGIKITKQCDLQWKDLQGNVDVI